MESIASWTCELVTLLPTLMAKSPLRTTQTAKSKKIKCLLTTHLTLASLGEKDSVVPGPRWIGDKAR